jgi:hypothetical protein
MNFHDAMTSATFRFNVCTHVDNPELFVCQVDLFDSINTYITTNVITNNPQEVREKALLQGIDYAIELGKFLNRAAGIPIQFNYECYKGY